MSNCFIALVGRNPLPVYISALSVCEERSNVFLVYTEEGSENISSEKVAENIEISLKKKINNLKVKRVSCDKSDIKSIEKTIRNLKKEIDDIESKEVIIDYTGGTKIMSAIFTNEFSKLSFTGEHNCKLSYVLFRSNEICRHAPLNIFSEDAVRYEPIEKIVDDNQIDVEDIVNLHGYTSKEIYSKEKDLERIELSKEKLRLVLIFNKTVKKLEDIKDIKGDNFEYFEIAQKIGGTESKIEINIKMDEMINNSDKNKFINKLKDIKENLNTLADYDYERLSLKFEDEDVENK